MSSKQKAKHAKPGKAGKAQAAPDPRGATERIALIGEVDQAMARDLREKLCAADPASREPLTIEVTTPGGDADMALRMIEDIDSGRARLPGRRLVFLGVSTVFSAGMTLMSGFPRQDRYLTKETLIMIHGRQLEKTVEISGPIRASCPMVRALLHQLETGVEQENRNFARLIEGSDLSLEELQEKALYNWYLRAGEALDRGLIAAVL